MAGMSQVNPNNGRGSLHGKVASAIQDALPTKREARLGRKKVGHV